jgi:glyoxylase-like metal-dependent hydrolase (beta-lactamase superfamily II)
MTAAHPIVEPFFHTGASAYAYLVFDPATRRAAIIDAVLDFDRRSGQISSAAADDMLARVRALGLEVEWILETHAHADHLSAANYLRSRLGCAVATGAGIVKVQAAARRMFNLGAAFKTDGSQFDRLLDDEEELQIGALTCRVLATPGHTPDSCCFLIGDNVFVGDTLFLPDVGTARCDFPGASARELYESVRRLYRLPDATRVMTGHDYPPANREPVHSCDIASERLANIHLGETVSSADFVEFREARDRTLPLPELFFFALQANVRAGRLPEAEANAMRYFRVPLSVPSNWPRS